MGTATMDERLASPWFTGGEPPDRSLAQRKAALQRANDVRTRRAQLKRDMKAGRRTASAILADPPEWAESMKLIDLLLAMPKWGRVKVNKALVKADPSGRPISPSKTVGGLSPRVRLELLRWLHER